MDKNHKGLKKYMKRIYIAMIALLLALCLCAPAFADTLSDGSTGDDVRELQQMLVRLGYLNSSAVDGIYGGRTASAVKSFQRQNSLSATGTADDETQEALREAVDSFVLSYGDTGNAVRTMQERLIELGYLDAGDADGVFGSDTQTALNVFKSYNGLSVDGEANSTTLEALYAASALGMDDSGVFISDVRIVSNYGSPYLGFTLVNGGDNTVTQVDYIYEVYDENGERMVSVDDTSENAVFARKLTSGESATLSQADRVALSSFVTDERSGPDLVRVMLCAYTDANGDTHEIAQAWRVWVSNK